MSEIYLAVGNRDFQLHKKPRFLRRKAHFPVDLHSGRILKEFVSLADEAHGRGIHIVSHQQLEDLLSKNHIVFKFGPSNVTRDIDMLTRYDSKSEFNLHNIEIIPEFNHYIDLERNTWNFNLGHAPHIEELKRLFSEQGQLFVKTLQKGFAFICESYDCLLNSLGGDLAILDDNCRDIMVSQVIQIQEKDEFRHRIFQHRLISSEAIFGLEENAAKHIAKAQEAVHQLKSKSFASTYVLDTVVTSDSKTVVCEANSFFASGVYNIKKVVPAIIDAILQAEPTAR